MTAVPPVRAVAVVVPAHDEQERVLACLDAVAAARERLRDLVPSVTTTVVVALDACHDDTAALVATRPGVRAVVVDGRCVGAARAAGTAFALAGLTVPAARIWTAHTDADSRVPVDWLVAMVAAADAGADAVLGAVVPDDSVDLPTRRAWSALHPPREGHPHVHGANLGVRASVLADVGGWRALVTGEDVDLADRLHARPGVVVRSTATPAVVTSGRPDGRAPAGFSSFLRAMTGSFRPTVVTSG